MLYLTKKDSLILESCYENFINNLKCIFEFYNITDPLECYKEIYFLLTSGKLSLNNEIRFDTTFDYIKLANLDNNAAHVMYGICACRHTSALINDILRALGFNSSLLYVFIDEQNNWHKLTNAINANHVVVILKYNKNEYLIDGMNNFIFQVDDNFKLSEISSEINSNNEKIFSDYDDPNIIEIGNVLKKYYNIKKAGISRVYEYDN